MDYLGNPEQAEGGGDLGSTATVGGATIADDATLSFVVDDATWVTGIDYSGTSNRPYKIARTAFGAGDAVSIDGATKNLTFGGDEYNGAGTRMLQHDNAGAVTSVLLPDLQSAYDNSGSPEIFTDGTRNGVTIQIGSEGGQVDTDNALEIANQAGTVKFNVQGDGKVFGAGTVTLTTGNIQVNSGSVTALNNVTATSGSVTGATVVSTGAMTAGNTLTVTAGVTAVNDDIVMRTGILDISRETTSATLAGAEISRVDLTGHDGTAFAAGATIRCVSTENWSGAARGSTFGIRTNATGEALPLGTVRLLIDQQGRVVVNKDFYCFGSSIFVNAIDAIGNVTVTGAVVLNGISAPANGGADQALLYKKTFDNNLYWLPDTAGAEINITKPPAISVQQTTAQTFTSSGAVVTRVEFKSELFKNDITHDNVTNTSRLTITKAGIYRVSYGVSWEAVINGYRLNFVAVNGNITATDPRYARCQANPDGTDTQSHSGSALISLAVNDYVELFAQQNSGFNVDIGSATVSLQGFFDANWISSL